MTLFCVRCAAACQRVSAVSVADGNALCGKHLHGYLFGGRTYSGWLEPQESTESTT